MRLFLTTLILCVLAIPLHAQGTFQNLNFESAMVLSSEAGQWVSASSAIPGWTAYYQGRAQSQVLYNTLTLGSGSVDFF